MEIVAVIIALVLSYVVIRLAVAHGIKDALGRAEIAHHVADIRSVVVESLGQGQDPERDTPPVDSDAPWFKRP